MSEYQYYEFRAVDRPLSRTERDELRAISTRARITERSFANSYDWGNFKGSPDQFMERYFDLFLYLANWGSRRFSMRLPVRLLDASDIERFVANTGEASIRISGDNLVLDVIREEVELEDWDDGRGWLDALAPLRADVLDGDLRVFYLVWLMAVEIGAVPDDAVEPLPGIAPLTPQLEEFADFFCIDADLVEAAANTAPANSVSEPSRGAIADSIRALPESEKIVLLLRLHDGDPLLRAELRRRCRVGSTSSIADGGCRRTASELRAIAHRLAEERRRAEAERMQAEQRRREQEQARDKMRRLDALAARGEAVWRDVDGLIRRRNNPAYDKAAALLTDLRDLALRQDTDDAFHHRLAELRMRHATKPRFVERLVSAGLE